MNTPNQSTLRAGAAARRAWARFALTGMASLLAACSDQPPVGPGAGAGGIQVASIAVTPTADTLVALGDTLRMSATVRDASGNSTAGQAVTWTTSDDEVATVTGDGLVTARGNGAVTITAAVSNVEGNAALAVQQLVTSVAVTPSTAELTAVGQQLQFTAAASDANANGVDAQLLWLSGDPRVATVDTAGLITAQGPGETTITAAAQGVPGHAVVNVTQTGTTLAFRVQPSSIVAGEPMNPAVQVELLDADGNVVAGATDAVTLQIASNPAGGDLLGTFTVNAVSGVATFSGLTVNRASAAYTLAASAAGYASAIGAQIEVRPAAPTQLAFLEAPPTVVAGEAMTPAVRVAVQDRFGNTVLDIAEPVELAIDVPGEPAPEIVANEITVDGVATFDDIRVEAAASDYTLEARAGGLATVSSVPFAVIPASSAQLGFGSLPVSVEGTGTFRVTVEVQDAFGNLVPGAATGVSLRLEENPSEGTLSGVLEGTAVSGVASFDVSIDRPGSGYSLTASSATLDAGESADFAVHLTFTQVSGDGSRTCGITGRGMLYCWGGGLLGDGQTARIRPIPVLIGQGTIWADIDVGAFHSCGRSVQGELFCWGSNNLGQLGDGSTSERLVPTRVAGGLAFQVVSVGRSHTCGIVDTGEAFCWGNNTLGKLGDGTNEQRLVPTEVATGFTFLAMAAGEGHTCGLVATGEPFCWGSNTNGELGVEGIPSSFQPIRVTQGLSFSYDDVVVGFDHSCGLSERIGRLECWGRTSRLGIGSEDPPTSLASVVSGILQWTGVSAGDLHTCGIDVTGSAYCWGDVSFQGMPTIGDGGTERRLGPAAVVGGLRFLSTSAGGIQTCGLAVGGDVYCWGRAHFGDGSTSSQTSPVPRRVGSWPAASER